MLALHQRGHARRQQTDGTAAFEQRLPFFIQFLGHSAPPSLPFLPHLLPSLSAPSSLPFRTSLPACLPTQVMETTGALQLIVPLMLTVFFAKASIVADESG
jgi:hypothetical protein